MVGFQGYPTPYPAFLENSNDDPKANCDPKPNLNSHLYSFDAPGGGTFIEAGAPDASNGLARFVSRMNAVEFVRVLVHKGDEFTHDGKQHVEGPVQGSRASNFVSWRSWVDFKWDATTKAWGRTATVGADVYNEITLQSPPDKNLNAPALS